MATTVLGPSVVSHDRNPALEDRQKDPKLKASRGCTLRACLKIKTKQTHKQTKNPNHQRKPKEGEREGRGIVDLRERIRVVTK